MLGWQEVNLNVVIYDSLERQPAGFNAQFLANLYIDYDLPFGTYYIGKGITSSIIYNVIIIVLLNFNKSNC